MARPRDDARLRVVLVVVVRQQFGGFVVEIAAADDVGLDLVAHAHHFDEIGGVRVGD
ncbi:MAG TPA: hypothetical protein PK890_09485 [Terrimesophilobacter sp.]|nr:hypothetical protein [Terrimesophilobacter sp.]